MIVGPFLVTLLFCCCWRRLFAYRSLSEVRTIINLSAQIVCGIGVFALGSSSLGLDNSELIGCDGSRYALRLSALYL